jgi:glutamate N-acetyltransferase/amino-acid N-acetyltransferase
VGRAGVEDLDVDTVSLSLNGVLIAEKGARAQNYTEQAGVAAMAPEDLLISVNLARGNQAATIWTTDFSYDYVKINAEYRT